MDPSLPHDIEDAWGFFRADPTDDGHTLVTYGVLFDMGNGLLRDLFETKVLAMAMTVPDRMRDLLSERRAMRAENAWSHVDSHADDRP
jgi:hypothetical protein